MVFATARMDVAEAVTGPLRVAEAGEKSYRPALLPDFPDASAKVAVTML